MRRGVSRRLLSANVGAFRDTDIIVKKKKVAPGEHREQPSAFVRWMSASLGREDVVVADRGVTLRGLGMAFRGFGETLNGLVKRRLGLRTLGPLLRGLLGLLLLALAL